MEIKKSVYTPEEIKEILCIGNNNVYTLMKQKGFPSKKIGNKWIVPIKSFDKWLEGWEDERY